MNLNLGDTQLLIKASKDAGLTTEQTAYVLATAYHETNHTMKPVREAYWLSEDWRKRNLRYYPYYGRGYVQLTWEDNYRKAGKVVNIDLVSSPDYAMIPDVSAQITVQGMKEGWFTGKKLSNYINSTKKDYVGARRIVNGTDRAKDIAAYAVQYEAELRKQPQAFNFIQWLLGLFKHEAR